MIEDVQSELPTINPEFCGYKNRYAYLPLKGRDITFHGFLKYDMKEEKIAYKVLFGESVVGGELCFAKRTTAQDDDEDDGYLMTFLHNNETNKSEFAAWDAKTMELVLRAPIRGRVPQGFHTCFIQEKEF